MLDIANDIRSLSDFKRNTSELLDRIKKTGNPLVLTINGKAEVVIQDAEAYQELLERVERVRVLNYGRSPHVYRVFFTIDETVKVVRVVHIRRGAREKPAPGELKRD